MAKRRSELSLMDEISNLKLSNEQKREKVEQLKNQVKNRVQVILSKNKELYSSIKALEQNLWDTIRIFFSLIENKSPEVGEHCVRVSKLAMFFGRKMKLSDEDMTTLEIASLLHDIGKAVDQQIEGSHVDIGIKILEKFGAEKGIILAMKSHHEDYPYENLESILVQAADQISGARPGARKDTAENYLKRLADLEKIATDFNGVEKAWALQAGREIRVFVKPEQVDDLTARKMAKDIAQRIQDELRYPGEIKVNLIRELRVTEHAR